MEYSVIFYSPSCFSKHILFYVEYNRISVAECISCLFPYNGSEGDHVSQTIFSLNNNSNSVKLLYGFRTLIYVVNKSH